VNNISKQQEGKLLEDISQKELSLILAIQQHPLATYDALSEFTQIPKSTVFEIAKKLEKLIFVTAQIDLDSLGLELVDVFVKADKAGKVSYLEYIGQNHPFVSYYSRIYGTYSGIYLQFRIPKGTISLLSYFFQLLKNQDYVEDFTMLQLGNRINYTTVDVNAWDFKSLTWKFSWRDWFDIPTDQDEKNKNNNRNRNIQNKNIQNKNINNNHNKLSWLQSRDIAILSTIFYNVRRSNISIKEELIRNEWEINDSTLSRRLKHIKEDYVSGYRVQINGRLFDLVNTILIWGHGSEEELRRIQRRIESHPIPFISTFKIENFTMYWYIHLPTYHLSELLYNLRIILDEIHFFYVDYPRAKSYSLDPKAWVESKHEWNTKKDYFCGKVIEKAKADFEKS